MTDILLYNLRFQVYGTIFQVELMLKPEFDLIQFILIRKKKIKANSALLGAASRMTQESLTQRTT